jgi:hypothetical protein
MLVERIKAMMFQSWENHPAAAVAMIRFNPKNCFDGRLA